MFSIARYSAQQIASRALRKLTCGGALVVVPVLLPRFGEPSAILVADITCPQSSARVVASGTVRGGSSMTTSAHSGAQISATRVSPRTARPSLSVRLRALWEGRGRTLPAADRVQSAGQPAIRSSDLPRS